MEEVTEEGLSLQAHCGRKRMMVVAVVVVSILSSWHVRVDMGKSQLPSLAIQDATLWYVPFWLKVNPTQPNHDLPISPWAIHGCLSLTCGCDNSLPRSWYWGRYLIRYGAIRHHTRATEWGRTGFSSPTVWEAREAIVSGFQGPVPEDR